MRLALLPLLLLLAVACSTDSGPEAPAVTATATACMERGCLTYPSDWDAETGGGFVSLVHPVAPDQVRGTLGVVDMKGLVEAVGGSWPAPPDVVVEALFRLLGEDQDAEIDGAVAVASDRSARAEGSLEGLRFWYRLVPLTGTTALGVEMRAPNRSWAPHAEVMLEGVEPLP